MSEDQFDPYGRDADALRALGFVPWENGQWMHDPTGVTYGVTDTLLACREWEDGRELQDIDILRTDNLDGSPIQWWERLEATS